jgi:hypothetical protein
MSFQNPSFLWALFAVAIPLIIHLFNFRKYKKVIFSNVQMLKQIQTESRKTRQIKKWLVLLARMLAIACLVLAFALPFIPSGVAEKGRNLVSVYLDNSQSMNAEGENGQLFENGKNVVRQLLQNLPAESEVQFLDNGLSPYSSRLQSPANAIKLVDDMEMSFQPNNLNAVVQKANNKFISEGFASQQFFAVSDFQKEGIAAATNLDSAVNLYLVRLKSSVLQNLSVDSAWLAEPVSRPGEPVKLRVKVTNNGSQDVESAALTLKINGVQQGVESFTIAAKSQAEMDMAFTPSEMGWVAGELSLDDVPVVFDNNYYFSVHIKKSLKVLQVGASSNSITKIFSNDPTFNLTSASASSIDFGGLATYDFIILNQLTEISSGLAEQLKQFAEKGGAICVIPPDTKPAYQALESALNLPSYQAIQNQDLSITNSDLKHPFFKGVYKSIPENMILPKVTKSYKLSKSSASQAILSLKNGDNILTKTNAGQGVVYQFTVSPASTFSNLPQHELFVLAMLKMAFSKSAKQQLAYSLYTNQAIDVQYYSGSEATLSLTKGENKILVESSAGGGSLRYWLNENVKDAGVYSVTNKNGEELAKVALNYSRQESNQTFSTDDELKQQFKSNKLEILNDSPSSIKQASESVATGKPLWKLFIILSLIFLLIEILLLRFLKS